MKIQGTKLMQEIVDKQFEIIGINIKFADIPETGLVKVGKKEEIWWNVYKMTEDQERQWKEWAATKLRGNLLEQKHFERIDLIYGFVRKYEKEILV